MDDLNRLDNGVAENKGVRPFGSYPNEGWSGLRLLSSIPT